MKKKKNQQQQTQQQKNNTTLGLSVSVLARNSVLHLDVQHTYTLSCKWLVFSCLYLHLPHFHYKGLSGWHGCPPPSHALCHLYIIFWVIITAIRPSSVSLFHFLLIGSPVVSVCLSLLAALFCAGLYNREPRQRRREAGTACH